MRFPICLFWRDCARWCFASGRICMTVTAHTTQAICARSRTALGQCCSSHMTAPSRSERQPACRCRTQLKTCRRHSALAAGLFILPSYRGQGTGLAFFAMREAHAIRVSDCDFACFCTVVRSQGHPARPFGARSLDGFRRRQGYSPVPDLYCNMSWREVGGTSDSELTLQFWVKSLTGKALMS